VFTLTRVGYGLTCQVTLWQGAIQTFLDSVSSVREKVLDADFPLRLSEALTADDSTVV